MFRYKNISSTTQTLIGYGEVEPGKKIETDQEIHNQNFELVEDAEKEKPKKTKK